MQTNVQRVLEGEIAQSRERIARYTAALSAIPTTPEHAAARAQASKAVETERANKLALEERLDQLLGRRRPRRGGVSGYRAIRIALGLSGLILATVLTHFNKHRSAAMPADARRAPDVQAAGSASDAR